MEAEEEAKEDKKVVVMGEDFSCGRHYRHHHSGSFAGMMFIVGGAILLLNTLNIVPLTVWNYIWKFWPLILVFWGLKIIFGYLRWLINLAGFILIILIGLFAVYQVMPALLPNLPPIFYKIFAIMKGIQR